MNGKSRNPWKGSLAAMAIFALWGLWLIFNELPLEWALPNRVRLANSLFFAGILVLPAVGLCTGWIKRFPRWSYPYVAHMFFFSWYMTNAATPGFLFGRELWGWRAWIPLMGVAVISLSVTRSLDPLRKLLTNIGEDWTVLTFGLFGGVPLLIAMVFDEMDRLYSLYFMVILTLLMVSTAALYMRRPEQRGRIAVLLVGIPLTILLAMAGPTIYWSNHGGINIVPSVVAGVVILLLLFAPASIGLFHWLKKPIA